MKKGYKTVAVDPVTNRRITEMAMVHSLKKSQIVEKAVENIYYYEVK